MSFFQSLYDKNKYVRTLAQKLGFARTLNLETQSPRIVEYPWTLTNFPAACKVLDIGSSGSQLPVMLACLGFDVWTLDARKYEYTDLNSNLHSITGDLRRTDLPDNFFDVVTAVSTLEHIGLGRYGDPVDTEGDRNAIKEIKRIMVPNGTLLLTVPFGKRCTTVLHRVYDKESLLMLLQNFEINRMEFFVKTDKSWTKKDYDLAKDTDSSDRERAIACVKATKPTV